MPEDFIRVYKIRRRSDGKFSNGASCSFSKNGKTWESLGHVTSHLSNQLYKGAKSIAAYQDCELVTIEIPIEGGEAKPVAELVARIAQRRAMAAKHGSSFADLVTALDKKELIDQFRWCLVLQTSTFSVDFKRFHEMLTENRIKRSGYRVAGTCIAFADKASAALMRLSAPMPCISVDLVLATEVDLQR